jgi:protein gp37
MGDTTGIAWTDSTQNFWEGCQKVGPGCDHCYAEARNHRFAAGANWGPGAPRRHTSKHIWTQPAKWQREADAFEREHGHPRRVFCSSLSDIFDNAVPEQWQLDAFAEMQLSTRLRWQLLTKRVGNVEVTVPAHWKSGLWPRHVGLMITVVTQREIERDVPKLWRLKRAFGIPWVGLSVEPLIEPVAFRGILNDIDWVIVGGESGSGARRFDAQWAAAIVQECREAKVACFVKQMGENYTDHGTPIRLVDKKGGNPSEWPKEIRVRQFPKGLMA